MTLMLSSIEMLVTDFLKWYQAYSTFALYPSTAYQRKATAIALYRELLNVFGAGAIPQLANPLAIIRLKPARQIKTTNLVNFPLLTSTHQRVQQHWC